MANHAIIFGLAFFKGLPNKSEVEADDLWSSIASGVDSAYVRKNDGGSKTTDGHQQLNAHPPTHRVCVCGWGGGRGGMP